jgi:hypothetical protein
MSGAGVVMSTGRSDGPDGEIRRWLSARLGEAAPRARGGDEPAIDETPTSPARVRAAMSARPPRWATVEAEHDEDVQDPATELVDGSLEDERDPRTVRVHRLPLSFIGESVFDPDTVKADGWSAPEGHVDEVPLHHHTPGTPPARRQRPVFRPPVPPPPPAVSLSVSTQVRDPRAAAPDEGVQAVHVLWAVAVGVLFGLLGGGAVLWLATS